MTSTDNLNSERAWMLEASKGTRRVLEAYANNGRPEAQGKTFATSVFSLSASTVSSDEPEPEQEPVGTFYYSGVEDPFLNCLFFVDYAERISREEVLHAARTYLPSQCDALPYYTLSFFAAEHAPGQLCNEALRSAILELCQLSESQFAETIYFEGQQRTVPIPEPDAAAPWKLTRFPIMGLSLKRTTPAESSFRIREGLRIVPMDGNDDRHCAAFESICAAVFHYQYSDDLFFLHRPSAERPEGGKSGDAFHKLLLLDIASDTFIGLTSFTYSADAPYALLGELAVHPDHQRKGYGAYLLEYAIHALSTGERSFDALLLESSFEGFALYCKFGFRSLAHFASYRLYFPAHDD